MFCLKRSQIFVFFSRRWQCSALELSEIVRTQWHAEVLHAAGRSGSVPRGFVAGPRIVSWDCDRTDHPTTNPSPIAWQGASLLLTVPRLTVAWLARKDEGDIIPIKTAVRAIWPGTSYGTTSVVARLMYSISGRQRVGGAGRRTERWRVRSEQSKRGWRGKWTGGDDNHLTTRRSAVCEAI